MINPYHFLCSDPCLRWDKDFSVRALGINERIDPIIVHRPGGTSDYFISMFYDSIILKTNRGIREYPGNMFMIWPPGTGHYYGHPAHSWAHSWMHVAGTRAERLFDNAGLTIGEPFAVKQVHLAAKYLRMMLDEIIMNYHADKMILFNHLDILLRELRRDAKHETGQVMPREFAEVKAYIETCFRQKLRLDDLARKVNLSVPQFCARFKRLFGSSAIDYQIQLRMQDAAFLMRDINMNISQIAQVCGYDDAAYFSKLFRRTFGKCPRTYRQKLIDKG